MRPAKVLAFTVSRADGPRIDRTIASLALARSTTGMPEGTLDWRLYRNSSGLMDAELPDGFELRGDGINRGQHIPLREVLADAEAGDYTHVLKVDDDLEWMTKRWLRKLVFIEQAVYQFSAIHPVLSPIVRGLKHPIPVAARVKVPVPNGPPIPLLNVSILGGACRLHHISFFNGYVADVRRALGAGGDTTVAQHASRMKVGMFAAPWIRVRHNTRRMEERWPEDIALHNIFQHIPYMPDWRPSNGAAR